MRHHRHRSLLTASTVPLGRPRSPHARRLHSKADPYGQLSSGKRPQCGRVRRYKDTVRDNLQRCGIHPQSLISAPHDREQWRSTCRTAIAALRKAGLPVYRGNEGGRGAAHKHQVISSTNTAWPCDRCNKVCSSRIELFAHRHTHR